MKLRSKMQFISYCLDVNPQFYSIRRLVYDQIGETLWIMTHTRKDGAPVDATSGEIACFNYRNSIIILLI